MNTDRNPKDSAIHRALRWKKETAEYLISTAFQPAFELAVVKRCRFKTRMHGVRQVETTATSTLAHVQQFAVASTTETTETLAGRADVRGHHRGTAKEITHVDVEMVRRFGAAFLTVVFELPLSDVTVVDGERAAFDCRVTATPAAEVPWYVDNVEFRQTDDCRIVFTAKELIEQESTGVTVTVRIRPDEGSPLRSPPPSSSRRTQQRRRGRRTVARLISDRVLGPTAVNHLRRTRDSPFTVCLQ